jgi:hypothetical protein
MHKRGYKNGNIHSTVAFLLLSDFLVLFIGCGNSMVETGKKSSDGNLPQVTVSEVNPLYVKFRSYQTSDSTWGYTIFLNSRPYLHYTRIPFFKTGSGFTSKKDAEIVAGTIVKMIQNGDMAPKLNKRITDSIESKMKIKEEDR